MSQLGMGVMIQMLGGNKDTVEAVQASLGKTIASMGVENNQLRIRFTDGEMLTLWDGGQSCCEMRWMESQTDDLSQFAGATLTTIEIRDANPQGETPAPEESEYEYDVLESQFLWVTTSKGVAVFANYNDHNGYYGGFWIQGASGDSL